MTTATDRSTEATTRADDVESVGSGDLSQLVPNCLHARVVRPHRGHRHPEWEPDPIHRREHDATGLYYYRARYYDPIRSRFVGEDPIGLAGGDANVYVYVANTPLTSGDALGLWGPWGHSSLTARAINASRAFSQQMTDQAIAANLNVDRLTNQGNSPAHYMPGSRAGAEALINASLARAIELARVGRLDDAIRALGEGLHTVQDRYAHHEQNAGWLQHPGCDDPQLHPREFDAAREASRRYVERFLLGVGLGR